MLAPTVGGCPAGTAAADPAAGAGYGTRMTARPRIVTVRDPDGRSAFALLTRQRLPIPPEQMFPFFADAHNLERITPPFLRFRVLTPPPIAMVEGTLIEYRLRLHGLPIRWLTRIAVWEPPHRFVDEQLQGPYRLWRHEHTFEPDGAGGTLARDHVEYQIRGGEALGSVANRLLVARDLERIFSYRACTLSLVWRDRPAR